MKKSILTLTFVFFSIYSLLAGTESPHDNGFKFNLNVGMLGDLYGFPIDENDPGSNDLELEKTLDYFLPSVNFGFEVGNKFTISRFSNNKISFGIVADWFGASYGSKKSYFPLIGNLSLGHLSVSMLEVGPTFTYALNDKMGIDLYYQLQPMAHILIVGVEGSYENGDPAIGFSHAVGVGFRYKVFALGVEPNFGKLNNDDAFSKYKVETAQLKINLGLKF